MYCIGKMKPDTLVDYAVFQLSPRRSRCELFISSEGNTEKLASGLVKPFVTHLKIVEEQFASAVHSIKLEVERINAECWFTKGTFERFVRFVSTPEILESISTLDAEMNQLEAARKIYSKGAGDQTSGMSDGKGTLTAADATKKELLRAIDVRLVAVRQDLTTAVERASAAGFNPDTVSELQFFADHFGAHHLNEACTTFLLVHQRRPDLLKHWKPSAGKVDLRVSCDSDMSIDDPAQDQPGLQYLRDSTGIQLGTVQTIQQPSDQSKLSKSFTTFPLQSPEKTENRFEKEKAENLPSEPSSSETNRLARRLSVQDRISLFENKQKENSGGKPIIVKPAEVRRLSSDVTSAATPTGVAEKTGFRRWSGASDMSIASSGSDKKDNADSPACMSLSSASLTNSDISLHPVGSKESNGLSEKLGSETVDVNTASDGAEKSGLRYQAESPSQQGSSSEHEDVESKVRTNNQEDSQSRFRSYITKNTKNVRVSEQATVEKLKVHSDAKESDSSMYQAIPGTMLKGSLDRAEPVSIKNQTHSQTSVGGSITEAGDAVIESGAVNSVEDVGVQTHALKHNRVSQGHSQSLSGQLEAGFGLNKGEAHNRTTKGYQLSSQARWGSFSAEVEDSKKGPMSSENQSSKGEDSGFQKMKFQKPVAAAPAQRNKSQARGDEKGHVCNKLEFSGKVSSDGQKSTGVVSRTPLEQVQKVKQLKRNQNLNNELKMKANELEKLFAEHQLCVRGDQSTSACRNKPVYKAEQEVSFQAAAEMASVKQIENDFSSTPPNNLLIINNDSQTRLDATLDYSSNLADKFSKVGFLDDSRGKLYDIYMQKREAKLREEWSTQRPEKEAKLKAMRDSLERSRAEIRAKLFGSSDGENSISGPSRRVERLRSFDVQSIRKMGQNEEDEDKCEFLEHQADGRGKLFSGEVACRSTRSKKSLPSGNTAFMTPRTGASVPRSSVALNTNPGKRRMHSENILAVSVSNSSDQLGENEKASGVSKMTTRVQVRSHARSKSSMEETPQLREQKPQRSYSLRRSSSGIQDFRDASSLSSDGVALESDRDWTQNSFSNNFVTCMESKHLVKNNTGKDFSDVANMSKKASSSNERLNLNASKHEDLTSEEERRKEEEYELESMDVEGFPLMEKGKPRTRAYSSKLDNSGSEIDVSADSPVGSPASLNSHMINQPEADVVRMRKKWGSAQKSILVANSSQNQFRKDATKGFKRLLKFGKKNRGTENMADWISATTSEGDDDTEDIQDPTYPSSDDLRKSRMGFSQSHHDNGLNESELLSEVQVVQSSIPVPPENFKLREDHMSGTSIKAPRSIFSLSSLRNKGIDAKPR